MFEQAFRNIDDVLWKEAGCTTELDYTEQTSWLLFLKYLDDLEKDKSSEAALEGRKYTYILDQPYRWQSWAAPKDKDGKLDHNSALTGDDLRDFVNQKLFPYLHGFKQKASGSGTLEYKIGEIFGEIKNKIQSGYNLREIIDHIDELRFRSQTEKHELSHLYETKIRNMGNAGRNGGEYYTPRPLIRAIVQVLKPQIGELDLRRTGGSREPRRDRAGLRWIPEIPVRESASWLNNRGRNAPTFHRRGYIRGYPLELKHYIADNRTLVLRCESLSPIPPLLIRTLI